MKRETLYPRDKFQAKHVNDNKSINKLVRVHDQLFFFKPPLSMDQCNICDGILRMFCVAQQRSSNAWDRVVHSPLYLNSIYSRSFCVLFLNYIRPVTGWYFFLGLYHTSATSPAKWIIINCLCYSIDVGYMIDL